MGHTQDTPFFLGGCGGGESYISAEDTVSVLYASPTRLSIFLAKFYERCWLKIVYSLDSQLN